jgi:undecaprenyl diphosphate synthase
VSAGVFDGLDPNRIPAHVGCVMDGNGRWAQKRGLKRTDGHAAGEEALFDTVQGALSIGISWLTVYAFSTENWRRPVDEVRFLMTFNRSILRRRRDELNDLGVRVRFVGRRDWRVPRRLISEQDETIELTRRNRRLTLTFAFNYGGRAEIVDAVRDLARDVRAGTLRPERITEETIAERLYAADMPPPDLLIRTSGEQRISNFLLWEVAYSELWFTPVFWPDFDRELLFEAIRDFQKRSRRFGNVTDEP